MKQQIKVSVNGATQAEAYKKILIALGEPVQALFYTGLDVEDSLYFDRGISKWCLYNNRLLSERKEVTLHELVNILTKKYTGHKTEDGVDTYIGMPFYEAKWYQDGWRVEGYYKGTPYVVGENHKNADVVLKSESYKAFSTKEAALAWISKFTGHVTEDGVPLYMGMDYHRAIKRNGSWVIDQPYVWSELSIRSLAINTVDLKVFSTKEALYNWITKQKKTVELDNGASAEITENTIRLNAPKPHPSVIEMTKDEFMKIYKALLILVVVLFASCAKEDLEGTRYRVECESCLVKIKDFSTTVKGTWQYTAPLLAEPTTLIINTQFTQPVKASITSPKGSVKMDTTFNGYNSITL